MPQKTETIAVAGQTDDNLLSIAYGALVSMGWTIKFATEKQLIAYTPRTWNKYDHEINVGIADGDLTITSKHIHGEIADLPGRNKKFIAAFFEAFEKTKAAISDEQLSGWKGNIELLKQETVTTAQQAIQDADEIEKVMNLSKRSLYVTYGIMAINVVVFILMAISGVDILQPTGIDIINWGGNHSVFTLSGDWWRLVSCVFVHIGIIHLLFNMYALYMIGIYLEPMLGKARYIGAYLATGIFASVASLWWHKDPIASAGASGAIFGMYGVFLALLSTKLIPKQVRDELLKSIAVFIGYNLLYGMKSGVDNAAHIGGLVSGFIIGYAYYITWKGVTPKKNIGLAVAAVLVAAAVGLLYINSNKTDPDSRRPYEYVINSSKFRDGRKMMEKLEEFTMIEEKALAPLNDTLSTDKQKSEKLESSSMQEWEKASNLLSKMRNYDISPADKKRLELLNEYVQLRKDQISSITNVVREESEENQEAFYNINNKIEDLLRRLQNSQ